MARLWRAARKFGPHASPQDLHLIVVASAMASGGAFHGEHTLFRYDEAARLPLIKCPVLLISGSDGLFHQRLETVRRLVPKYQMKIIEDVDGFASLEKPGEFAHAVLEFLNA